jgi:pyruvyl transferase EpsO
MSFKSTIDLHKEIHKQLAFRINSDFVLLDTPDHINIGDQMIWQGEMDFFDSLGVSPNYISSHPHFDWRELPSSTLILLHGGGNFGDVWKGPNEFRLKVIEKYPKNRIIVLPQSVQFSDISILEKNAKVYSKHENLTICARDSHSFELLKRYFSNEILLVPDMAFCSKYENSNKGFTTDRKLLMKRFDRENKSELNYNDFNDFDITDWPSCEITLSNQFWRGVEKANREFAKYFISKKSKDTTFGLGVKRDREYYIEQGIDFMSKYEFVVSTRLHGHILALHLGIPSIMIDNNYGKNSRFYNTWLSDFSGSKLVSSIEELKQELENYKH